MKKGGEKRTKRSSCCTMCWCKPNKPPSFKNYVLFYSALLQTWNSERKNKANCWFIASSRHCTVSHFFGKWSLLEDCYKKALQQYTSFSSLNSWLFQAHTCNLFYATPNSTSSNKHLLASPQKVEYLQIHTKTSFWVTSQKTWKTNVKAVLQRFSFRRD